MKPFFILGAPRSGTTLLRDILRQVDELHSPEETHFYRISAPFGGVEFTNFYQKNPVMKKHRELDGISDEQFFDIYNGSYSRADFNSKYSTTVANAKGANSWFDKTPQNCYGLPLLLAQFPDAKFIHLVRHPLSVAKSLMEGKVMKPQSLIGSLNYWLEAVSIINVMKPILSDRLLEVKYEDLQQQAGEVINKIFLHLDTVGQDIDLSNVRPASALPLSCFSQEDLSTADKILGKYPSLYEYSY